jgi:hypothetical protein
MTLGHDFLVLIVLVHIGPLSFPTVSAIGMPKRREKLHSSYRENRCTTETDFNLRPAAGKPRLFSGYTSAPFWYGGNCELEFDTADAIFI